MQFVTDFADQALLLPLAALIAIFLAASGARRTAVIWCLAVGGVFGTVLVLKLAVIACGFGRGFGLMSPSGHTAAAAVVYGGLAALLLRRRLPYAAALALGAVLPAAVIGATRLALLVHTPADVVAGGAIGLVGAAAIAAQRPPALPLRAINRGLLGMALLALLLHGHQARAESRIAWLAQHLWPFSACKGRVVLF